MMPHAQYFSTIILLCLLMACGLARSPAPAPAALQQTQTAVPAEEDTVYTALITQQWHVEHPLIRSQTKTMPLDNPDHIRIIFPGLDSVLIQHYIATNQQPTQLLAQPSYELLDQAAYDAIFDRDLEASWRRFHQYYPAAQGLYTLSRVGFNQDYTQALVGYSVGSGPVQGAGY